MSTKKEQRDVLMITKNELLEKSLGQVDKKIAELKQLLAENMLNDGDFLNINANKLKERIRIYQQIETLLSEVIEELFEGECIC